MVKTNAGETELNKYDNKYNIYAALPLLIAEMLLPAASHGLST